MIDHAPSPVECPACLHRGATSIGAIPSANYFAGRTLEEVLPGGTLFRCERCELGFRFPRLPKSRLDELYRAGTPTAYRSDTAERADWQLAKRAIDSRLGRSPKVLDVGCFDGGFLDNLDTEFRFGIEINSEAAARAHSRKVNILGTDFEALPDGLEFDAITTFDVIEHVHDPRTFLRKLIARLAPGGLLLISTGNLDAWTWRIAGARYWYCAIPEHISFLSRRWFEHASAELGIELLSVTAFSHRDWSVANRGKEALANSLYLSLPSVCRYLRSRGVGTHDASRHPEVRDYPPSWMSAKDHVLAVYRNTARSH